MKRLFVDVDGIVADFVEASFRMFGLNNPYTPYDKIRDEQMSWELLDYFPKMISQKLFWDLCGYKFWSTLPKHDEADSIMQIAGSYFRDNMCFMTAPCPTHGCVDGKKDWCNKHYPHLPLFISLRTQDGPVPKFFCAGDGNILIDDNTKNCQRWRDAGGEAFLYPRPWNTNHMFAPAALRQLEVFLERVANE